MLENDCFRSCRVSHPARFQRPGFRTGPTAGSHGLIPLFCKISILWVKRFTIFIITPSRLAWWSERAIGLTLAPVRMPDCRKPICMWTAIGAHLILINCGQERVPDRAENVCSFRGGARYVQVRDNRDIAIAHDGLRVYKNAVING